MSKALVTVRNTAVSLSGDYEKDLEFGSQIRDAAESLQFVLGDWVLAMQEKHGDTVASLAQDMSKVTGVGYSTLRQYADVARAFPPAERSASMTFSHHLRAAYSDNPKKVLKEAEKKGLSVRDTERLARGLPLGGEETAKKESEAVPASGGVSLEEIALSDLASAKDYISRALATMQKPGFRMTVPVGQRINEILKEISSPFLAIEELLEDEVGAYL